MKKKVTKKKYDPSNGKRQDWKNDAENEIITLFEDIDQLGLPEDSVLAIEKIVNQFKERLNETIEQFEITPEIATQDDCFAENLLDEMYYCKIPASEYNVNRMIEIIEQERGGQFVKADSLAEQIKLDEFIAELTENPYQLKLIA